MMWLNVKADIHLVDENEDFRLVWKDERHGQHIEEPNSQLFFGAIAACPVLVQRYAPPRRFGLLS